MGLKGNYRNNCMIFMGKSMISGGDFPTNQSIEGIDPQVTFGNPS